MDITKLLAAPLNPTFAILLIFVGSYSLTVNTMHEKKQNHYRAAKFARVAGWCYIIGGAGILIYAKILAP